MAWSISAMAHTHLHWTITSGFEALSAHVVPAGEVETGELPAAIRTAVHRRFGIEHVTVQVEAEPCGPRGSARC